MPAINVARTDTFELQRQKINQIGSRLFDVTGGGSDLSTGNLKLGDGTKTIPSLAFVSDDTLGLYKAGIRSIGFVSGNKRIINIQEDSFVSFKDFNVINKSLNTAGTAIDSGGSGYDTGSFPNVALNGGTGADAEATITVSGFIGSITQAGEDYLAGTHTAIISGGNGSGAVATLVVPEIAVTITSAGTNFAPGEFASIPLTGGNGTGAQATVVFGGEATVTASITTGGSNYVDGNYNDIALSTEGDGLGLLANITVSGGVVTVCTTSVYSVFYYFVYYVHYCCLLPSYILL